MAFFRSAAARFLLSAAVLATVLAVPQQAIAGPSYVCPNGWFCLYEHIDLEGAYWQSWGTDSDFRNDQMSNGLGLDNRASSAWNKDPNCWVTIYTHPNFGGPLITFFPGIIRYDLRDGYANDKASSQYWDCP